MPLTFFTVFFNIFDSYLRACYSSVIGSFSKDFLQRILILIVLTFYSIQFIDFQIFIFLYIAVTCLPTIILLIYIILQKEWHIKPIRGFMSKELRTEMIKLGTYSILAGGAGAVVLYIDAIMVNSMLGEEKTGIYSIAFQIGTIILIPARSLYRIMTSIVAEAFKKDDIKEIASLYKKSCNNQLAIGLLLFIGIVVNINNIMQLIPQEYATGKNVILILSFGYLIEMATGINQVIISNSKHYKYDTFFVFLMVGVVIISNLIFIPIYGIIGSAIATATTVVIGNVLRFLLLFLKFKMQPYDINTIKIILVALLSILPNLFIPELDKYIDIFIRSSVTGGIFIFLLLKLEATPDLNKKIRKNLKRFQINS